MTVTQERFADGLTYDEYKAQMTRNRERFDETERTVELTPSDIAYFKQLEQPVSVLVIAEDWCGDVINNLPVLGRLAEDSGKLDIRVFLRDQNLDIMDQYLKNGEFRSIPVFVVFDQHFNEVGHFIERPAAVTQRMTEFRTELFTTDPLLSKYEPSISISELPDDVRQHYANANTRFRAEVRSFADREVIREIRELVSNVVTTDTNVPSEQAAPLRAASQPNPARSVDVRITYCAECGYEPQTLDLTSALMREFVHGLGSITLIPWHDGAFDVVVDGELIHSMYRDGGFPASTTIIDAVRKCLQA